MAAKKSNSDNILIMAVLAAGGYFLYTEMQKQKAAAATKPYVPAYSTLYTGPGSTASPERNTATSVIINPVGDTPATDTGVFVDINGAESNVATAQREFELLINSGLVNPNANALNLTAYEKDVVYKDQYSSTFGTSAKLEQAANAIWEKYPGLKV